MKFTPRMRLHGKKTSETQIKLEISSMLNGTGSRPYPFPITEIANESMPSTITIPLNTPITAVPP